MKGPIPRLSAKLNLGGFVAAANNAFNFHNGFSGAAGGAGITQLTNADGRLVAAGSMAIQGVEASGGVALGAPDATGTLDITFTDQITEFDIYSTQNTGHASYYYSVDGGALTKIDGVTANATPTRIFGVEARDGSRKEISCRNLAISGIQSASMLTDSQACTHRSMDKALAGDLSFIMRIIDDVRAATAIATTKANIKAKAQDALLSGDCILVMEHFVNDSSGNMAQWLDYRTPLYQIADELEIPLIDMGTKWGSFAVANAAGKMSDTLHPSFLG